jgi:hypothetical protein
MSADAAGRRAQGHIDAYVGVMRLEATLAGRSRLAKRVQRVVGQMGQLLLEKK